MVYTGGFFMVLFHHFRHRTLLFLAGIAVFIAFTATLILFSKTNASRFREMLDFQSGYQSNQWGGRSLRIEKWKNALECYAQFPFLGTGAGDCSDELMKTYEKNTFEIALKAGYNPHNQYLQTLLTLGPIGLILFLAMFAISFYRARRQGNFFLFLLAYAFAASMITESMLERQTGVFLFTVLLTFFASVNGDMSESAVAKPVE
jgi:O-antigen ligase